MKTWARLGAALLALWLAAPAGALTVAPKTPGKTVLIAPLALSRGPVSALSSRVLATALAATPLLSPLKSPAPAAALSARTTPVRAAVSAAAALESAGALFDGSWRKAAAARRDGTVDDYFGTQVADPYRWMEDLDSAETQAWVRDQNRATAEFLASSPSREAIAQRLAELVNYDRQGVPERQGPYWVYERHEGLRDQPVLYKARELDGKAEVLLDPNTLSADGTAALQDTSFSKDGKYMAYSVAESGSDWTRWRVREVATGRDLPDAIEWTKFSDPSWDEAGTGFYYTRYAAPKEGETYSGTNENEKVYFHALGTSQDQDRLVHERPDHPHWSFAVQRVGAKLFIYQYEGTEPKNRLFVKDLTDPAAPAAPLFDGFDATYHVLAMRGDRMWVFTTKDAPRGRLVLVDRRNPAPENWKDLIPQSKDVLTGVRKVGKLLVASYRVDAHDVLKVYDRDGRFLRELELPSLGSLDDVSGARKGKGFFSFSSFTHPKTVYRADFKTGKLRGYKEPKLTFDPKLYEVKQVFYPSKDGTRIPMFLVHKKGLKLDGTNPTYLYGYGGFNISETPDFSATKIAWLEMGGVYAVANLRGGGEYGKEWHDAGRLDKKQNVFDDFIAAAEWLIREKYTSKEKLAIGGGSNGGLLVGAVMTQRPDLFAAAVPEVGVLDMLRFHLFTVGAGWRSDYGSSETQAGFETLLKYSPLHNVKPGVEYPATLVMTGDHDDRVVPSHSYKFTAALQAAQAGGRAILARIEADAGHGAGTPISKILAEIADKWAFLRRALGMDEKNLPAVPGSLALDRPLADKVVAAADQMLAGGHADPMRGEWLSDWSFRALELYRLAGLSEDDIRAKVASRLELFLDAGRAKGLSQGAQNMALKALPPPKELLAPAGFAAKHGLAYYTGLRARLGAPPTVSWTSYNTSLKDAFRLSLVAGDDARSTELFFQMLKMGNFEAATGSAEAAGREDLLIHVGLFALADYNDSGFEHLNGIWYATEALKRVQGPLKPRAAEILYDLAAWLQTPEVQPKTPGVFLADYAVRALRSTGRLLKRVPIDSAKVDFVTVVEDPRYAAALRKLLAKIGGASGALANDDRIRAMTAIGDADGIRELVGLIRARDSIYIDDALYDAVMSLGDAAIVRELAEAVLADRKTSVFGGLTAGMGAARLYAGLGDSAGVERVRRILAEDGVELRPHSGYPETLERYALQAAAGGVETVEPRPAGDYEVERIRGRIAELRSAYTDEQRRAFSAEGRAYLAARDRRALDCFIKALDRDGLIAYGDLLLSVGDGLNAKQPFLFAALLSSQP